MKVRILVNPELLTWARERAGLGTLVLAGLLPKLSEWETGELQPTLRQLEDFARAVHVVVTHEVPANSVKRIKIPNACIGLNLRFITPYEMLCRERARFVLGEAQP